MVCVMRACTVPKPNDNSFQSEPCKSAVPTPLGWRGAGRDAFQGGNFTSLIQPGIACACPCQIQDIRLVCQVADTVSGQQAKGSIAVRTRWGGGVNSTHSADQASAGAFIRTCCTCASSSSSSAGRCVVACRVRLHLRRLEPAWAVLAAGRQCRACHPYQQCRPCRPCLARCLGRPCRSCRPCCSCRSFRSCRPCRSFRSLRPGLACCPCRPSVASWSSVTCCPPADASPSVLAAGPCRPSQTCHPGRTYQTCRPRRPCLPSFGLSDSASSFAAAAADAAVPVASADPESCRACRQHSCQRPSPPPCLPCQPRCQPCCPCPMASRLGTPAPSSAAAAWPTVWRIAEQTLQQQRQAGAGISDGTISARRCQRRVGAGSRRHRALRGWQSIGQPYLVKRFYRLLRHPSRRSYARQRAGRVSSGRCRHACIRRPAAKHASHGALHHASGTACAAIHSGRSNLLHTAD
eukprot:359550-Chlamydomonas_euryale.AAC.6